MDDTEIGGFGIALADDLLLVEDFVTVKQEASVVSVSFDDASVADLFDDQVDAGRRPEQFARIWLHTHPGDSSEPSGTDEETFQRVFGKCQWAVMFILARGGRTYARLRYNIGPGARVEIPVSVDYSSPFGPSDHEAWRAEYHSNVKVDPDFLSVQHVRSTGQVRRGIHSVSPDNWWEDLDLLDPWDREAVMDELALDHGFWEEEEVFDEC